MDAHHLSKRLAKVAEYVPKGARLADIGSDHAYLPAYLALNHMIDYGIAGEVVKGPYDNAVQEIKDEDLEGIIYPRLADGLDAIKATDQIDTITICGMGGTLIRKILNNGEAKLQNHPLLILQPNVGSDLLRQWLFEHHYQITNEDIIDEDHHIYEIIVAKYTDEIKPLSSLDLKYGIFLRQNQTSSFKKKWQKEIDKNNKAIEQMRQAKKVPQAKIDQLEEENNQIKGVLENDNG